MQGQADKLVNAFLDGLIDKGTYIKKKDELLKMKIDLQERLQDFEKKGGVRVELLREWAELAHQAGKLALSNDFYEIKQFVKKIGSNRRVIGKKVLLDVEPPYELVSEYRAGRGMQYGRKGLGTGPIKEDEKGMSPLVLTCRGEKMITHPVISLKINVLKELRSSR